MPRDPARLAIVTGGSRGIGAAICVRLAADGFAVAVNYTSQPERAAAVVAAIERAGGTAAAFHADVADPAQLHTMFADATGRLGPLAALVNCAGIIGPLDRSRGCRQSPCWIWPAQFMSKPIRRICFKACIPSRDASQ